MPQAIPYFIATVFVYVDAALVYIGFSQAASIFIINMGIRMAGLALLGALARSLTSVPNLTQTATSQLLTKRSTIENQRIVYGKTRLSGVLHYLNTAGTHNQVLYHSIIVAGHEIDDITDMWIDDIEIPNAAIDWPPGNGSVDSGDFRGNISTQTTTYFEKNLGGDDQSASAYLQAAFTEVTSQHQGRGIAYFVVRNDYFDGQTQVWSAGAPQNFSAIVKGKKVYNPNSDGTQAWGTGPHRVNSEATWEYTNNPALHWADYMTWARLGFGESADRINWASVASAAAINSAFIAIPNSSSTKRFAGNGALNTGNTHEQNLVAILSAANMTMSFTQGQWKLRGWEYETPVSSFDDTHLRGDLLVRLASTESERYNTVRGIFIDSNRLYKPLSFPPFSSAEYITRDNGEVLFKDIQLPMTTDVYMAQRLAAGILEHGNLQTVVTYPSNFKTLPVDVGGTLALSNTKLGWSNKPFRVNNFVLKDMEGIDLILQEDDSAAYADVGTAEYTVSSGGGYVTANPGVPAPNSLWQFIGQPNHIVMEWNLPPARLFETVELWASRTNNVNSMILVYEGAGKLFNHKVDVPNAWYYHIRAKNHVGEYSAWVPSSFGIDARAGEYESLTDFTFDKGETLDDFWDNGFGDIAFRHSYVTSKGLGGSQALSMVQSYRVSGGNEITKPIAPHQIQGDTLNVRLHYRVESYAGVSAANSQGIRMFGAGLSYVALPARIPPITPVNTGSFIVHDQLDIPVASLTLTGSWAVLDVPLAMSNAYGSGHKLGNFYVGNWNSTPRSQFLQIYIDNISMRYS